MLPIMEPYVAPIQSPLKEYSCGLIIITMDLQDYTPYTIYFKPYTRYHVNNVYHLLYLAIRYHIDTMYHICVYDIYIYHINSIYDVRILQTTLDL